MRRSHTHTLIIEHLHTHRQDTYTRTHTLARVQTDNAQHMCADVIAHRWKMCVWTHVCLLWPRTPSRFLFAYVYIMFFCRVCVCVCKVYTQQNNIIIRRGVCVSTHTQHYENTYNTTGGGGRAEERRGRSTWNRLPVNYIAECENRPPIRSGRRKTIASTARTSLGLQK